MPILGVSSLDLGRPLIGPSFILKHQVRGAVATSAGSAARKEVLITEAIAAGFSCNITPATHKLPPCNLCTAPLILAVRERRVCSRFSQPSFGRFLPRLGPFGFERPLFLSRDWLGLGAIHRRPCPHSAAVRHAMIFGSSRTSCATVSVRSCLTRAKLRDRVSVVSLR
jgi:hypothetical protein